jgi:hypothetical protein
MDVESILLRIDRLAGGRHGRYTVSAEMRADPRTRSAFVAVTWLLVAGLVVGTAALVVAVLLQVGGQQVPLVVWMRLVVVLGMTTTLFYFAWRAQRGFYWAYSRLRLFSMIFPIVALGTAAIPGLYPRWMISEQIVFSIILIGVASYLSTDHMREAFPKPTRAPKTPTRAG